MAGKKRTPWNFHVAYCEGHHTSEGYWKADGRSERADTELVKRLKHVMIKRNRQDIWASTPPKTRQVLRIDVGAEDQSVKNELNKLKSESSYFKALEKTLHMKLDPIVENVIESLGAGEKSLVWVLTRESVEIMTTAIEKACDDRNVRTLMRQQGVRIWATHGEADIKVRHDLAQQFREHPKAGVLIATMDSMPEAISLFGATTEHYAQLHYLPGPMVQTENRPYLRETTKLHIIYYIAKGTIDERIEQLVLPRIEAMDKITGEKDASSIGASLKEDKKTETWQEFLKRLTRNALEDGVVEGEDFGSSEDG